MTARLTNEQYLNKCQLRHDDKFDYTQTNYIHNKVYITIGCQTHGHFDIHPSVHLRSDTGGCPLCAEESANNKRLINRRAKYQEYLAQAIANHGDKYDYSLVNDTIPIDQPNYILCPTHGNTHQSIIVHSKFGCQQCGRIAGAESNRTNHAESFEARAREIHGNRYDYGCYEKCQDNINITCPEHGTFSSTANNHLAGTGCPQCADLRTVSTPEQKLIDAFPNIQFKKDKVAIGMEIDLLYRNLGIEVNGVYWHSDRTKQPDHLLHKTDLADQKGIQLLHFWDIEVNHQLNKVCSVINSKLGVTDRIYARKTKVLEVSYQNAKSFLQDNHMQGSGAVGSIRYGLYFEDELVQVMTFGRPRFNKNYDWELIRLCSKLNTTIVGGASKLLKQFQRLNKGSILSYANLRWSNGNVYRSLGFRSAGRTKPSYIYAKYGKMLSRYSCQKHLLPKLLGDDFDPGLTEYQNMVKSNYNRVFDCGNEIFILGD